MSKIKMRCTTCGKWFQSANAKEVTCPECAQKARKDKLASKAVPPAAQKTPGQGLPSTGNSVRPAAIPPKQKPASSGTSHWFDSLNDVKVSEPDPPQHPKLPPSPAIRETHGGPINRGPVTHHDERAQGGYRGPASYRDERGPNPGGNNYRSSGPYRDERGHDAGSGYRGPGAYRNAPLSGSIVGGISQRPRQPMEGGAPAGPPRGPRPGGGEHRIDRYHVGAKREKPVAQKKPRPVSAPKPKREKIPPPEPFKPTPEQITQVETLYLELSAQGEFDGIRSQISQQLSVPKKAVKQIVKTLREREHIPSWWETQTYKGDTEEKEKIQAAYHPYLPIPPVGVHRLIADELDLKPGTVYQAIKTIRLEQNLPQYNDPTFHVAEFEEIKRKARESREVREAAIAAQALVTEQTEVTPPTAPQAADANILQAQVTGSESQAATEQA